MTSSVQPIYITNLDLDIPKIKIQKNFRQLIEVKKNTSLQVFLVVSKLEEQFNLDLNFSQLQHSKLTLVVYFSQIKNINCQINIQNLGSDTQTEIYTLIEAKAQEIYNLELKLEHLHNKQISLQKFYSTLKNQSKITLKDKIVVDKNSFNTNISQKMQALTLSKEAYLEQLPFLEIYNPTCVANHGTSNVFLDPKIVFYLQSRGLSRPKISNLLQQNFGKEVLNLLEPLCLRRK